MIEKHGAETYIGEKFLDRNDILVLEFNDGYVFLQVKGWEQYKFDPFTELPAVTPQDNSGFSRLEDSNGDDILYIEKGNEKVLHAGIGHSPSSLRRYTNYPESENRLRTPPNLDTPRSVSGSDYGYVDGEDSPYESPTDVEELVIPPGVHLDFDFYNPDPDETRQPVLNIKMREYNVKVLNPNENQNKVERALSPGTPIPTYPVGSIDNQKNISTLAEQWGVEPLDPTNDARVRGGR